MYRVVLCIGLYVMSGQVIVFTITNSDVRLIINMFQICIILFNSVHTPGYKTTVMTHVFIQFSFLMVTGTYVWCTYSRTSFLDQPQVVAISSHDLLLPVRSQVTLSPPPGGVCYGDVVELFCQSIRLNVSQYKTVTLQWRTNMTVLRAVAGTPYTLQDVNSNGDKLTINITGEYFEENTVYSYQCFYVFNNIADLINPLIL